jgi:hypothetical protein
LLSAISLSILFTLGQAGPPPPSAAAAADQTAAPEGLHEGRYAGMALTPEARNPLPAPKDDPPRLTWTGFSPGGAGGEIFLQTTRPIEHDMNVTTGAGGHATLSVVLHNCRIHWKNNARRIDTSFFATPVEGISARQKKKNVELSIRLKESVVPTVRTAPGPDGSHLLVLAFPAPATAAAQPAASNVAGDSAPAVSLPAGAALAPPPVGAR